MADFLASFNFGANDEYAQDGDACASVDDIQQRLRGLIDAKTTDTRAEHVSATLDIAGTAEFTVTTGQAHVDDMQNVDPLLAGGEPMDIDNGMEGQEIKVYTGMEALRNQPSQAPIVQQAVAEAIAMAAGVEDKSSWALHSCELGHNGWDFTFICEASLQHWKEQHKGTNTDMVADYTNRQPDPVLMGRPAFDCKGRIFMSFSRKARTISVKYDHTVLHKTVAELAEFYKPPPMIGPRKPDKKDLANAAKLAQQEAIKPKKKKRPKEKNPDGTPKEGRKKTRNKKQAGEEQTQAQLSLTDEASRALAHAGVSQLEQAVAMENGQDGDSSAVANGVNSGDAGTTQGQAQSTAKSLSLNVTPEEAARRKDIASKLLTEAGVSPDSLSADQLNIFANQSPELQRESLNMLKQYGAERLQIIHPTNRKGSTPVPPSSAASPGEANNSAPQATTTDLVLEETSKGKGNRSSRPPGKSRLACSECKTRRIKCPKERPSCTECQKGGLSCEYPPHKPRVRKSKSNAVVLEEDDNESGVDADADDTVMTETQADATPQDAPHDDDDGFDSDTGAPYSYPQLPLADVPISAPPDPVHGVYEAPTQLPYFQSASGLALPQPDPLDGPSRSSLNSNLALPESSVYYPTYPAPAPAPAPAPHQEPEESTFQRTATPSDHRRQPSNGHRNSHNGAASAWSQSNNDVSKPPNTHTSPLLQHGHAGSQSPDHAASTIHLQEATLLAQAASYNQRYNPNSGMKIQRPPAVQKSPFQPAYNPRSKSQQGHRSSLPPQRGASAFAVPPETGSNVQNTSGLHGRSSMGGLSTGYGSGNGAADPNKIGYKPYSYQQSPRMSVGSHLLTGHGGLRPEPMGGNRQGHSAQGQQGHHGLGQHAQGQHGQHTAGQHTQGQQGQHTQGQHTQGQHTQGQHDQHGQHTQNWQSFGNQGSHGPSQINQRQGYSWSMGDGWNRGHS